MAREEKYDDGGESRGGDGANDEARDLGRRVQRPTRERRGVRRGCTGREQRDACL